MRIEIVPGWFEATDGGWTRREGAMGTIIRVVDAHGRPAALKRLKDEIVRTEKDPVELENLARTFMDEIRLMQRVAGPFVLPVLAADRHVFTEVHTSVAVPYLVTSDVSEAIAFWEQHASDIRIATRAFVGTLQALCALRVVTDVLDVDGVSVAVRGVEHRDIKSDNLTVDIDGRVTLLDFGLGRWSNDPRSYVPRRAGTPVMMAPELLQSIVRTIDARADIYSAGAMYYALLVGDAPFPGADVVEVLASMRRIHDLRFAHRSAAFRATFGADAELVEAVVLTTLVKDPSLRAQHPRAVLDALAAIPGFVAVMGDPTAFPFNPHAFDEATLPAQLTRLATVPPTPLLVQVLEDARARIGEGFPAYLRRLWEARILTAGSRTMRADWARLLEGTELAHLPTLPLEAVEYLRALDADPANALPPGLAPEVLDELLDAWESVRGVDTRQLPFAYLVHRAQIAFDAGRSADAYDLLGGTDDPSVAVLKAKLAMTLRRPEAEQLVRHLPTSGDVGALIVRADFFIPKREALEVLNATVDHVIPKSATQHQRSELYARRLRALRYLLRMGLGSGDDKANWRREKQRLLEYADTHPLTPAFHLALGIIPGDEGDIDKMLPHFNVARAHFAHDHATLGQLWQSQYIAYKTAWKLPRGMKTHIAAGLADAAGMALAYAELAGDTEQLHDALVNRSEALVIELTGNLLKGLSSETDLDGRIAEIRGTIDEIVRTEQRGALLAGATPYVHEATRQANLLVAKQAEIFVDFTEAMQRIKADPAASEEGIALLQQKLDALAAELTGDASFVGSDNVLLASLQKMLTEAPDAQIGVENVLDELNDRFQATTVILDWGDPGTDVHGLHEYAARSGGEALHQAPLTSRTMKNVFMQSEIAQFRNRKDRDVVSAASTFLLEAEDFLGVRLDAYGQTRGVLQFMINPVNNANVFGQAEIALLSKIAPWLAARIADKEKQDRDRARLSQLTDEADAARNGLHYIKNLLLLPVSKVKTLIAYQFGEVKDLSISQERGQELNKEFDETLPAILESLAGITEKASEFMHATKVVRRPDPGYVRPVVAPRAEVQYMYFVMNDACREEFLPARDLFSHWMMLWGSLKDTPLGVATQSARPSTKPPGFPNAVFHVSMIEMLFDNLRANLIALIGAGATPWISTSVFVRGTRLYIRIHDRAGGMEQQILEKVVSLEGLTTKKHGSGTGWPQILRALDAHWGGLHVRSQIPQGTTITLMFPLGPPRPMPKT